MLIAKLMNTVLIIKSAKLDVMKIQTAKIALLVKAINALNQSAVPMRIVQPWLAQPVTWIPLNASILIAVQMLIV